MYCRSVHTCIRENLEKYIEGDFEGNTMLKVYGYRNILKNK